MDKYCVKEIREWKDEPDEEEISEFRRRQPESSQKTEEVETGVCTETERIIYEPVMKERKISQQMERSVCIREPVSEEEVTAGREELQLEEQDVDTESS
ncbi:hypothetical protein GEMRC1_012152 [Eukaryota sp. GEM-RC1]